MEMHSVATDIKLELGSEPASVAAARHAAARLAADVGAPEDDVRIAVSEAVGNAVVHGYRGRRSGPIILEGWVEGGDACWSSSSIAASGCRRTPLPRGSGWAFR